MPSPRRKPIDPFIRFLMESADPPMPDLTEAAERTQISRDTLYSHANRGVNRIDTMIELSRAFGVDIAITAEWISKRIKSGSYESDVIQKAS